MRTSTSLMPATEPALKYAATTKTTKQIKKTTISLLTKKASNILSMKIRNLQAMSECGYTLRVSSIIVHNAERTGALGVAKRNAQKVPTVLVRSSHLLAYFVSYGMT